MANYVQDKKRWLSENKYPLLLVSILGLLPFLPVLLSGQSLFASDQLSSPSWNFYFESLRKGAVPLWSPYGLAGMPTFDAGFGDAAYPVFLMMGMLLPATVFMTWMFVLHTLLAGIGAYYLVSRFFALPRVLSAGLAAAYMLNTNFISHIHAGHTGKFYVMAWLPLSLYFLFRCLKDGAHWRHALGLCLTIAVFLLTNHLQLTYFVLMGFFLAYAYKTFWLVKNKRPGAAALTAARFWIPIFLGLGLAFFMFLPPKKWTDQYGVRGSGEKMNYEHATSWSIHPEEAFSLVVPEFTGINERYWGRNPFKLNSEYPGISILFLGILGLALFRRAKEGWFWLWGGVGLLAIVFGLGAHTFLFRIFFEFIPGIKNFRAPSMMLFWLATALVIMSADMLSRLTGAGRRIPPEQAARWDKNLARIGFGLAAALLAIGLAPSAFFGIWDAFFGGEAVQNLSNRANAQSAFAFGAIKNAVLLGALVFGARKWLIRENDALRFGLLFLAVTLVDLYPTNANFIKPYDPKPSLAADAAVNHLRNDGSQFRVFGLPGAYERWRMQYHGIETVDGFTDNEYRVYREFRTGETGDYQRNPNLMQGLKQNADGSVSGSIFLDLLNVKYLAFRDPQTGQLGLAPNASALPRAWLVTASEPVPESEALNRMKEPGFDPRALALISGERAPPPAPAGAPDSGSAAASASATLREKGYNASRWAVNSANGGVMVLSELWFPHWNVEVDGKEAELLRVNFAFRGVRVPPGEHVVEYRYRSPWLAASGLISAFSLAMLIPFLFALRFASRKTQGSAP